MTGRSQASMDRIGGAARRIGARRALILAVLLIAPFAASSYWQNVLDVVLMACLGALALNLILGVAGQVSIGNAAFLAVGGLTASQFGGLMHWPFLAVLAMCGLVGAAVGYAVGLPSLRIRGIYLLVATLALQYVVVYVFYQYQTHKGFVAGFPIPAARIGSLTIFAYRQWYWLLLIVVLLVYLGLSNLMRGVYGRAWKMIRDAEPAATVLGVDVSRYKLAAFAISATIISLQGGLLAYFNSFATSDTYTLALAVQYAAMVVIGGLGSMAGAIIGAVLLSTAPYALTAWFGSQGQLPNYELCIYGAAMVLFFIFAPDGVVGLARHAREFTRAKLGRSRAGSTGPATPPVPAVGASGPSSVTSAAKPGPPVADGPPPLLDVVNLSSAYGRVGTALRGINLRVEPGSIAAVLGPNGAGKTTLLRSIVGFGLGEPGRVVSGTVRFNGEAITRRPAHELARMGIAIVPERNKVFSHLTVMENLQAVGFGSHAKQREALAYVFDLFPVLHDRLGRQAGLLSGGERQMLAVGRALMLDPKLLLADELSFGIAPVMIERLCAALRQINQQRGVGILMVEQNTEAAFSIATHVYLLEAGNVVMDDATESFRHVMETHGGYLAEMSPDASLLEEASTPE